ncbi:MAG: polyprenyl synthetase family protein [Pseudomonadales bacterium]|nr:polyprenyl synthetase family protein [Pseudomonadales bacterium]
MSSTFESKTPQYRQRVERAMGKCIGECHGVPARLLDALQFAVEGEGKRIRPLLVYATGELLGLDADVLDYPASAVEMIHTYSLVHDDLPAMDHDDLRRGKPTIHKQFDEATAILVGDALQSIAFKLLATADVATDLRARWIAILAEAAGPAGMAGGQSLDLDDSTTLTLDELQTLHAMKTGALIRASIHMAAVVSPELSADHRKTLLHFGDDIGVAFQVHDDVLDVTTSTEDLGKPRGSDERQGKSTYVSLLGLEEAKARAIHHHARAKEALSGFGEKASSLVWLADYIVNRSY